MPLPVPLPGEDFEALRGALLQAFLLPRLREMLRFRLDTDLDAIALGGDLKEVVFKVIAAADAEGWTARLVLAARASNPGNPALAAFAARHGLSATSLSAPELQRLVVATNSMVDPELWRSQLGAIEPRVCRVEVSVDGAASYGTGFLVAKDLVLTNHHVVAGLLDKASSVATSSVVLRFDYMRRTDGGALDRGTEVRLAADWLVDQSPPSPSDRLADPTDPPAPDCLDYALLRTAGEPGVRPVGGQAEPGAAPRGWVEMATPPPELSPGAPLFILQHPSTQPLKLAIDTEAVLAVNSNGTRVRYRTNTEHGSSGSPCFDRSWSLAALHHAGDPLYTSGRAASCNQGIPVAAILALLEKRGLRREIGRP